MLDRSIMCQAEKAIPSPLSTRYIKTCFLNTLVDVLSQVQLTNRRKKKKKKAEIMLLSLFILIWCYLSTSCFTMLKLRTEQRTCEKHSPFTPVLTSLCCYL